MKYEPGFGVLSIRHDTTAFTKTSRRLSLVNLAGVDQLVTSRRGNSQCRSQLHRGLCRRFFREAKRQALMHLQGIWCWWISSTGFPGRFSWPRHFTLTWPDCKNFVDQVPSLILRSWLEALCNEHASLWQDTRLAVCKVGQEIYYLQILSDSMMNMIIIVRIWLICNAM